ncbi:peptidoglycan-binding domain-containing protein [Streptomyces sp. NPDC006208]|uniref:peptidoglycan-binding domain-containing protein n=1 Tax=Streptomyces sp. NPDC006208 TaxID=3156734 RepID=UPI0033A34547
MLRQRPARQHSTDPARPPPSLVAGGAPRCSSSSALRASARRSPPARRSIQHPTCRTSVTYTTVHGSTTSLPAAGRAVSCLLAQGNSSRAVTVLQQSLNACYDARLTADGVFGAGTQAALRRAQAQEGQRTDGVYGPQSRDALQWRVTGFACDRVNGPGGQ